MKSLIEVIVKGIVGKPEEVSINEIQVEKTTVFELKVAEDDLGKVIGKQGRTAKAIRSLLSASAKKRRQRAALEILE